MKDLNNNNDKSGSLWLRLAYIDEGFTRRATGYPKKDHLT